MADFTGVYIPGDIYGTAANSDLAYNAAYFDGSSDATVTYLQRVYSSGLAAWCYFNGVINTTPVATMTTPNWTGAITAYERLGRTN